MNQHVPIDGVETLSTQIAAAHARLLGGKLRDLAAGFYPPSAEKTLRRFSAGEVARLLGITEVRLRQLPFDRLTPDLEIGPAGRRYFTLAEIHTLRSYLHEIDRVGRGYLPHRNPEKDEHLQVIALTNFKGGSAKTTHTAGLAHFLTLHGYRVLAIDADPQASLSTLLGMRPDDGGPTIYDAVRYGESQRPMHEVIRKTYFPGLDLASATLELEEYEFYAPLMSVPDRRKAAGPPFFARLAVALESVAVDYDVVVIDCPPRLGYFAISALCAATATLITVHPQMIDLASMRQFLTMMSDLMETVKEQGAPPPAHDWFRYLITRYDPQSVPQTSVVGMLNDLFGPYVLPKAMLQTPAVSTSGLLGQTIYETSLGRDRSDEVSRATYRRALDAFDDVNREIELLIRRTWRRA
ncbi:MAG: plasmid partitioning protein RepA [Roseococcus sp.]|uniref:plasmid partitioning protein RepA n=1 Tax=Methylobacterium sp. TaxID=409 RepID=UPI001D84B5B7|nr:plasmid partitioning protein RepA [Methylobacterium sp.]MBX9751998.1 plasmid partitioning protein RepA [Roseococcus sp.]MBX9932593.1 plasmid partitioning protein RepA [Methylobacterium sp.]